MTTKEIERKLYSYWDCRKNIMVPRITGSYKLGIHFETDMIAISKTGFMTGFEIKISRQDFMKDFKKPHLSLVMQSGENGLKTYYGKMKHFYYVMPEDLAKKVADLVPEHFGIIAAVDTGQWGLQLHCMRPAPKLFNYKLTHEQQLGIARLGCIRLINL